jgi:hypothetical protein
MKSASIHVFVCFIAIAFLSNCACEADELLEKGIVTGYLMAVDPRFNAERRRSLPAIIPKDSELRNQIQSWLFPSKAEKKKRLEMKLKIE